MNPCRTHILCPAIITAESSRHHPLPVTPLNYLHKTIFNYGKDLIERIKKRIYSSAEDYNSSNPFAKGKVTQDDAGDGGWEEIEEGDGEAKREENYRKKGH